MKRLIGAWSLLALILSADVSVAATSFICESAESKDSSVNFSFDKEMGFNFEDQGWMEPLFYGPYITLSNSNLYRQGKFDGMRKGAVVKYKELIGALDYLTSSGVSDGQGVVSGWIEMSGIKNYEVTTAYEIDLSSLDLVKNEVVIGDRVQISTEKFSCKIDSKVFE